MAVLAGLEPRAVFQHFEEICAIPHGSGNERGISNYLVEFAKAHGLRYIQDDQMNVIIFKDGTAGYENSPAVIIQGHMDMVCEKEKDCDIDFEKDGLRLILKDGVVKADGTTLGGDDGIAVAYALAILEADDIPHPPLECIFTVEEETGLYGAEGIDCSMLQGRIMLNLDSEEEGFLLVSSAGGYEHIAHLPFTSEKTSGTEMTITLGGLTGGHSGSEINKFRGNASQLLARLLFDLKKKADFRLIEIAGGFKDNAIPRECVAKIVLAGTAVATAQDFAKSYEKILKAEHASTDPELFVKVEAGKDGEYVAMTAGDSTKMVAAIINMPGGIQRMNPDMPEMVQTSLNMGILKTLDSEVEIHLCVRSAVDSEKLALRSKIDAFVELLGGSSECEGDYPGWEYNKDSRIRDVMVKVFKEQYGREPVVQGIHAGLECGMFAGKLPGLDCISYGPDLFDVHTPAEHMMVDSVKRTWDLTLGTLAALKF